MRTDAAAAQQVLRDIRSAEAAFKSRRARFGTLPELIDAGLLATTLKDGIQPRYRFAVSANIDTYEVVTEPDERSEIYEYVGSSFFLDESGTIRWAPFGKMNGYRLAAKTDPPVR